jgi:hypothetical protein
MHLKAREREEPFGPLMSSCDRRTAIPADFRGEPVKLLADMAARSVNPLLKARLADMCWLLDRKRGRSPRWLSLPMSRPSRRSSSEPLNSSTPITMAQVHVRRLQREEQLPGRRSAEQIRHAAEVLVEATLHNERFRPFGLATLGVCQEVAGEETMSPAACLLSGQEAAARWLDDHPKRELDKFAARLATGASPIAARFEPMPHARGVRSPYEDRSHGSGICSTR